MQHVLWTLKTVNVTLHDMSVNLGGFNVGMAHQCLEDPDIDPVFQHVGGETVAQGMAAYPL